MEKILSVIVPAYNIEKYLERCLKSMEVPGILERLEVWIINDGSSDSTEKIAQNYCIKYPETYFFVNKKNGGHGSCINSGIEHATGKYFKVLDGDDWLNTEELEEYVNLLEKCDADIVASDFLCIQDETDAILQEKFATKEQMQYNTQCTISSGSIREVLKMHMLTIKTEILKQNHIVIDEHCYYVDSEYITYPIPYADSVYFYPRFIYMYRLGRDGQSMNILNMQKNRAQHQHVLESMLNFYKGLKDVDDEHLRYIAKSISQVVENQFQIYISMGLQKRIFTELKAMDTQLKKEYPAVYAAVSKKSIYCLRATGYIILPFAAVVYRIVRRKRWKKH